jgi:hypothetical protein
MNRYESSTPRAALGLTAVAMAAITMATLIVLPAEFDSVSAEPYTVTAARAATSVPIEVVATPARSEESKAAAREAHAQPNCASQACEHCADNVTGRVRAAGRYLTCTIKSSIFGTAGLQPAFS